MNGHSVQCFGEFGGPVFPYVAFGNFSGDEYKAASVLVVTFSVNNYVNDTHLHMAQAWEKQLVVFFFLIFPSRFSEIPAGFFPSDI